MENTNILFNLMKSEIVGNVLVTSSFSAMVGMAIASLVKRNKKINNSVTKKELECGINKAKNYTDDKLKAHEDNQNIEIENMKKQIEDTHGMVKFLYETAITKTR